MRGRGMTRDKYYKGTWNDEFRSLGMQLTFAEKNPVEEKLTEQSCGRPSLPICFFLALGLLRESDHHRPAAVQQNSGSCGCVIPLAFSRDAPSGSCGDAWPSGFNFI